MLKSLHFYNNFLLLPFADYNLLIKITPSHPLLFTIKRTPIYT